ncbi:MAG: CvpA family protein [Lachnospiraceae bacterium]|nr:CvpA family protein [Lachnospiraceae bacterium]
MNILLIILVIICAICALYGYKQGVLGLVWSVLSWLFIAIFVMVSEPYIEDALMTQTRLPEMISEKMSSMVEEQVDSQVDDQLSDRGVSLDEEESASEENQTDHAILGRLEIEIPEEVVTEYTQMISAGTDAAKEAADKALEQAKEDVVDNVTDVATKSVIRGIAQIIAFLVAILICCVVRSMIRMIDHTPIIGSVGHILGLCVGLANGLLIVYLLFYITEFVGTTAFGSWMLSQINENEWLLYVYNHNLLKMIIENFLIKS